MAFSIVAEDNSSEASHPRVSKSSRWYCDVFTGPIEALVEAGICAPDHLIPQPRRAEGRTAFLPSGEACPTSRRAWREPGYKAVIRQEDGTYAVEVTVSNVEQQSRRKVIQDAEHEREQVSIVNELAERGHEYCNWRLSRSYGGGSETWEGTKEQLQQAGLGLGCAFPGEPGGPEDLLCKCPLGFDFRIYLPKWNRAKSAARIYTAQSAYIPYDQPSKQFAPFAPGVTVEVWAPGSWSTSTDTYLGTAASLIAAGIVPELRYFPGQPLANATRASYREDWRAASPVHGHNRKHIKAVISKRGNQGRFMVELPVTKAEQERRQKLNDHQEAERKKQRAELAVERERVRETAINVGKPDEEFRAQREGVAVFILDYLWKTVFTAADGAMQFDISEDGHMCGEIGRAFQAIKDAVQTTKITRNRGREASAKNALKLVAARNDAGLQAVLGAAKGAGAIDAIRNRRD